MPLDFSKITLEKKEEKAAIALLSANEVFNNFVDSSIKSNSDAAAAEIEDKLTIEYQGKMAKLDEFRDTNIQQAKDLEAFAAVDISEYERLKKLGGDNKKNAEILKELEVEHAQILQAKTKEAAILSKTIEEKDAAMYSLMLSGTVSSGISSFNAKNPTLEIDSSALDFISHQVSMNHKKINDRFVFLGDDGQPYKDDTGFASIESWIGGVLLPRYPFLKKASQLPSGGAGSGGGGGGGEGLTMMEKRSKALLDRGFVS